MLRSPPERPSRQPWATIACSTDSSTSRSRIQTAAFHQLRLMPLGSRPSGYRAGGSGGQAGDAAAVSAGDPGGGPAAGVVAVAGWFPAAISAILAHRHSVMTLCRTAVAYRNHARTAPAEPGILREQRPDGEHRAAEVGRDEHAGSGIGGRRPASPCRCWCAPVVVGAASRVDAHLAAAHLAGQFGRSCRQRQRAGGQRTGSVALTPDLVRVTTISWDDLWPLSTPNPCRVACTLIVRHWLVPGGAGRMVAAERRGGSGRGGGRGPGCTGG